MSISRAISSAGLALVLLLWNPCVGLGGAFDTFGITSRNQAMGLTGVVSSTDVGALFYNPANLMRSGESIVMEMVYGYADMAVLLADRPRGYDPSTYDLRLNQRADTTDFPSFFGVMVGSTNDFGLSWFRGAILGYFPAAGIGNQDTHFIDEREQYFSNQVHFELLGERQQTQVLMAGAAIQPISWFSFGVALNWMPYSRTSTEVYTRSPTDPSQVDINLKVSQDARLAYQVGMTIQPLKSLFIGAAWRGAQFFGLKGQNEVQVKGTEETDAYPVYQYMDVTIHYSPNSLATGIEWDFENLKLTGDATWMGWSDFRSSHSEPALLEDTWEFGLGSELKFGDTDFRVGARYIPTPVPLQTGRTNMADNDRYVATMGGGRLLKLLGKEVQLDLHVQLHLLPQRDNIKDNTQDWQPCEDGNLAMGICDENVDVPGLQTGNPGFPGFSSGGWMIQGGGTLTWKF